MSASKQYAPKGAPEPTTKNDGCRANALAMARCGLSVFPLLPGRKEPVIHDWPNMATTDERQINAWFDKWPDANYALLANDQICFIDIDPRNGGLEALSRLEAEEPEFAAILKTLTVETGRQDGGKHLYFRPPKSWKLRQGTDALGPGVDVMLWHKYVVGPGSIHPDTGKPYRFIDPEAEISPLPSWVILRLLTGLQKCWEEAVEAEHLSTLSGTRVVPLPSPSLDDLTTSQLREKAQGYLVGGRLTEDSFGRLYQDPAMQVGMAMFVGVPKAIAEQAYSRTRGISDRCLCPRPGHDEQHPSADVVFYKRHQVLKVRCHHGNSKPTGLPDIYAMRTTGVYRDLTKAELKLWTLRMLVDMGVLDSVDVERRPLPDDLGDDAPSGLRETYHAIIEVLSLRYLFGKNPAPLVRGFLSRWSGLTEWAIGLCLQWLLKHWYLKGGVFLRADGTFSETRETKTSPECYELRLTVPKRRRRGDGVKRTRKEWAIYRQEQRLAEALQAEAFDYEPDDFEVARLQFEDSEAADFDDFDYDDDEIDMDDFEGEGEVDHEAQVKDTANV
jgi:Bifunctional DNA primase/polymerase, N-terminal